MKEDFRRWGFCMSVDELVSKADDFVNTSLENYINEKVAISEALAGVRIFDAPIFGLGSPDDLLFEKFSTQEVVSEKFLLPRQWLGSAGTVVSFFMPYSHAVKKSNAEYFSWPSDIWLHARYEGQMFLLELAKYLCGLFEERGAKSVVLANDPRFEADDLTSNWSERHVAYACGLGTFGISKGLITEKGTCGRFGSIITELSFPVTARNYTGIYDYCNNCGDCVENCPTGAISSEKDKDDLLCSNFLDKTFEKHNPRYGCGKCQVKVSCESNIP